MEESLIKKAKAMMEDFSKGKEEASTKEQAELIQKAIEAAQEIASPEEIRELENLEKQLKDYLSY